MSHFTKFLIVWIIILSLLYSTLSVLRHNHFQSGGFDLGLYDQAVWQYSRFLKPYNTIKERFILGDHLTLTLPLLAPLFWLWDNVRILLIFQAFWISFSSLAIYKLCRTRKLSPLTSFNLSFIYSLFYGIQYAVFFDFHPIVIGVGLISWLVYFLESQQKKLFQLTLVLLLLTQENMGIALACLGLVYLFKKRYRRLAVLFIAGGFGWSLLAAKIITLFSDTGFQFWPEISLNPLKIAINFFNTQEKRRVWLYSLSWFSFLPLLSPGAMLAVLVNLAQYFVTGREFVRMWSPFMHHRAILAPFLLLGVLDALELLKRKRIKPPLARRLGVLRRYVGEKFGFAERLRTPAFLLRLRRNCASLRNSVAEIRLDAVVIKPQTVSIFLVIISLGLQYYFHFPLNKLSKPIYWKNEVWMDDNRALFKLIPPNASLATQQSLAPHLSHRKEIYLVWPRQHDFENNLCGEKTCWWLDFSGNPQYLVVDLHPYQWLTQLLESNENFEAAVKNMEKARKINLEREINFAKLYKVSY